MNRERPLRLGPLSVLIDPMRCIRLALLALLVFLGYVTALCYGADWITPAEVLRAMNGYGENVVLVQEWRMPRAQAAVFFGAALGLAGALLQNLTRNPLGSPDIIGLDAGAYTGTLIAMTWLNADAALATGSALAGALAAAAFVILLSERSGLSGTRLIITGIAVNAILTAVNAWMVLRADEEVAMAATGWSAGSLNGISLDDIKIPLAVLAVTAVVAWLVAPAVHQSTLGDDLASSTGVSLRGSRLVILVVAVAATATVTAVAGPIAFIALAAPQIGRRIVGGAGTALLPAALTGAVLLVIADILAQLLLNPESLPVGVVTTCIGGLYLIWLLYGEVRRARVR